MPQVRVVLRDEVVKEGERLRQITKAGSLTELIGLMFSRYGKHLEQTWEVLPIHPRQTTEPYPEVTPNTQSPTSVLTSEFKFDEPLIGL